MIDLRDQSIILLGPSPEIPWIWPPQVRYIEKQNNI